MLWFEEEVGLGPKQRGALAEVVGMDAQGPTSVGSDIEFLHLLLSAQKPTW